MSVIREWKWNEHDSGSDGLTLYSDRVALWSVNWAAPFTDVGREWTLEEFRSGGSSSGIPPHVWKELNEEVFKLETKENINEK